MVACSLSMGNSLSLPGLSSPLLPVLSVPPAGKQQGEGRYVCHVRLKAERAGSKPGIAPYKEMG